MVPIKIGAWLMAIDSLAIAIAGIVQAAIVLEDNGKLGTELR